MIKRIILIMLEMSIFVIMGVCCVYLASTFIDRKIEQKFNDLVVHMAEQESNDEYHSPYPEPKPTDAPVRMPAMEN